MGRPTKSYKKDLHERLQDQEYAAAYLNAALMDEDPKVFLIALKDVADARGEGVAQLAKKTDLNRESLYRTLSERGNPRLNNLCLILEAMGLHLSITPNHL
jgi:probable addiction module antidote protein